MLLSDLLQLGFSGGLRRTNNGASGGAETRQLSGRAARKLLQHLRPSSLVPQQAAAYDAKGTSLNIEPESLYLNEPKEV